ncbi:MAG: AAA family ATPase [Polyangiaceae bacterium]|nr:AAA family ATPase [Polyangiaceae bacterium]MBK8936769.1 AAA family ATPase [Polyangiaceae bacterium]
MELAAERVLIAQRALIALQAEIEKRLYGQTPLVRGAILSLCARGNFLIEGQPGLGKTLLVKVLAEALDMEFSRIQCTPDLMPADVTGSQTLVHDEAGRAKVEFRAGPIFSNLVLADEINRATPKTQSALLEAMQEHAVTVFGVRRLLPAPFLVAATQNPLEMEGTYPLPEAQLDRFLVKLEVALPSHQDLREIGLKTTSNVETPTYKIIDRNSVLNLQELVREIVVAPHVADFAARLVLATHPGDANAPEQVTRFVRYGASPRAMQALILAGRAHALMSGRPWVAEDDVRAVAHLVLRHRMILSFDARLENVTTNQIVDALLSKAPRAS